MPAIATLPPSPAVLARLEQQSLKDKLADGKGKFDPVIQKLVKELRTNMAKDKDIKIEDPTIRSLVQQQDVTEKVQAEMKKLGIS
jgi:hypothetical protein